MYTTVIGSDYSFRMMLTHLTTSFLRMNFIVHLFVCYQQNMEQDLPWSAVAQWKNVYSGTSIYRSRNDRFPARTVRNFWSRMKFHINNVIYSRIHRSPNYRFPALIVCKSRSRRSISRMDRLKKKIEAKYLLFALPSIWTINLATQRHFRTVLRCKWFCAFSCDF